MASAAGASLADLCRDIRADCTELLDVFTRLQRKQAAVRLQARVRGLLARRKAVALRLQRHEAAVRLQRHEAAVRLQAVARVLLAARGGGGAAAGCSTQPPGVPTSAEDAPADTRSGGGAAPKGRWRHAQPPP
jgi:hypothetical protein